MYKPNSSSTKKKLKIGRWIILAVFLFLIFNFYSTKIDTDQVVVIEQGDTFSKFTDKLGSLEKLSLKIYIRKNDVDLSKIALGTYTFSGTYTNKAFLDTVLAGPSQAYQRYTVLEGRSIYDIDANLTKKGFIQPGNYINRVTNSNKINDYKNKFGFLQSINGLKTLEGFLYPDTYNIDLSQNFIEQLVKLQLQTFEKKVRSANQDQIKNFGKALLNDGFSEIDWYKTLILASIVEKEERNNDNKPTVAGIFLNRLDVGMRLDADVTLCYGLKKPYEDCPPSVIVENLNDNKNIFNTRQVAGIPSQPISNPSSETIESVLNYQKSDYLFYLHDNNGGIHFAKTTTEHGQNKSLYIK